VPAPAGRRGGTGPRLDERVRLLGRTLGRKEKKALAGLEVRLGPIALAGWIVAVRAPHRRAALLFAGDLPTVLGRVDPADAVARDVVAWGISETSLGLRRELIG